MEIYAKKRKKYRIWADNGQAIGRAHEVRSGAGRSECPARAGRKPIGGALDSAVFGLAATG